MEIEPKIEQDKMNIIKNAFSQYLAVNGHKITSERMMILEEIYSLDDHFDVVELHYRLRLKKF